MQVTRRHPLLRKLLSAACAMALPVLGLVLCPVSGHAQSLRNGSFEDPAVTTTTAGGGNYWNEVGAAYLIPNGSATYGNTPYGVQFLALNSGVGDAQTISGFTVGATYQVSLGVVNIFRANIDYLTITISGAATAIQTSLLPYLGGASGGGASYLGDSRAQSSLSFTPTTSAPVTITLSATGYTSPTAGTLAIDNVTLTQLSVPEPTTVATALLGAGALIGVMFRRRMRLA